MSNGHNNYDDVVMLWNLHSDSDRTFKRLQMTADQLYELDYALTREWKSKNTLDDKAKRAEDILSMIKMNKGALNPQLSSLLDLLDRKC